MLNGCHIIHGATVEGLIWGQSSVLRTLSLPTVPGTALFNYLTYNLQICLFSKF
jgi:hypothetical protein